MDDNREETLGDLIKKKRASGYDPEFEARLARIWLCPHCQHRTTILGVLIPVGDPEHMACPRCEREGIGPVDTKGPDLSVVAGGKR